jgi:DNA repair protein RecO (recombination protein O)
VSERPRTYKTEGIVLRRRNLGEADSVFTLSSETEGRFDGVARGVRKARSHMRGHLEPLTRARVMLARGRTLDVFTQAETVTAYRAIREDLDRSAAALYCAELVEQFTAEHAEQPGIYGLILDLLEALDAGAPLFAVRYFEVRLLMLAGYELRLDVCTICSGGLPEEETLLSPEAGGLICPPCRGHAGRGRLLAARTVKVLRFAAREELARFAALRLDDQLARELEYALADVIRYVLDREPQSGRFVAEVARLGTNRHQTKAPVE